MSEEAVLDFIEQHEGEQRKIMTRLHDLFIELPEVQPKIRFKVPFYYRKTWICYLNPLKDGTIELCFIRGNEFYDTTGLLEARDRKQVRGIIFGTAKDISDDLVLEIFQEAYVLDDTVPYASKRKNKK